LSRRRLAIWIDKLKAFDYEDEDDFIFADPPYPKHESQNLHTQQATRNRAIAAMKEG
jgi:DNA modification methylase